MLGSQSSMLTFMIISHFFNQLVHLDLSDHDIAGRSF